MENSDAILQLKMYGSTGQVRRHGRSKPPQGRQPKEAEQRHTHHHAEQPAAHGDCLRAGLAVQSREVNNAVRLLYGILERRTRVAVLGPFFPTSGRRARNAKEVDKARLAGGEGGAGRALRPS